MRIEIRKFGTVLSSRPAGKEAWLVAKEYTVPDIKDENIEIDFSGVQVLTPAWADEFLTPLKNMYGDKIKYLHCDNPTVKSTLEILDLQHGSYIDTGAREREYSGGSPLANST